MSSDESDNIFDSESEEERGPAKKKKKTGASMFIEDEADVDVEDDEDDDDEEEEIMSSEAREAEKMELEMAVTFKTMFLSIANSCLLLYPLATRTQTSRAQPIRHAARRRRRCRRVLERTPR